VAHESVQVVERLISEQDIDMYDQSLGGDLPLIIVLKSHQSYIFQLILSDGRTDAGLRNYYGQTPLHDEDAIQMLVRNQRVDVNCLNHRQGTPLLLHFKGDGRFLPIKKQLRIIEALLLSPFINLNHRDKDGRIAIWHAMDNPNPRLAELPLQQVNMDSNCIDRFGQTPLAQAAENGFLPLVKLLLRDPRLDISPRRAPMQYHPYGQHVAQAITLW
jgi:ankyrin repeat protein